MTNIDINQNDKRHDDNPGKMSDNNNNHHSDKDDVVAMIACEDCGHMVPESNLMIHKVRACQARARAPGIASAASEAPSSPPQSPVVPFVSTTDLTTPDQKQRQRRGAQKRGLEDLSATPQQAVEPPQQPLQPDVIDLMDSPSVPDDHETSHDDSLSSSCDNDNNNDNDEWACSKCTLLNDVSDLFCAACRHENPNRPPDAMRTDQLLPDYNNNSNSPLRMVGGGALLGGALGGYVSLMRGRGLFSGAMEGAMSGAMGGAVFSEVMNNQQNNNHNNHNHAQGNTPSNSNTTTTRTTTYSNNNRAQGNNNDDLAHARSSAVFGIPGYPSMSSLSPLGTAAAATSATAAAATTNVDNRRNRAQPRSSFRVVTTRNSGGTTTTIVTGGNGTSRTMVRNNQNYQDHDNGTGGTGTAADIQDPMLQMLLSSFIGGGGGEGLGMQGMNGDNVDGMDYEQLLQAFGNGTENLGATPSQISQLPCQLLTNPQTTLPKDAQTCYICLETFETGETRKTLPCLHGFHQACADKWLLTNGSCPICKHKVGSGGG